MRGELEKSVEQLKGGREAGVGDVQTELHGDGDVLVVGEVQPGQSLELSELSRNYVKYLELPANVQNSELRGSAVGERSTNNFENLNGRIKYQLLWKF